jgi:hypothetical protein
MLRDLNDDALSHVIRFYTHLKAHTIRPFPVEKEFGRGTTEYIVMEHCHASLEVRVRARARVCVRVCVRSCVRACVSE